MKTMLTSKRCLLILLLAIALVVPVTIAYADGPAPGDQFVFGSNYTLQSGETLSGDLVVFGGNARTATDSIVSGDVIVFGGNAYIDGFIKGDIAVMGGSLNLGSNALVNGDTVSLGGSITRQPGAVIEGDIDAGPGQNWRPEIFEQEDIQFTPPQRGGFGGWLIGYFLGGLSAIAISALLAALGLLLIVLIPGPTERVLETVQANTGVSFGFGFLLAVLSVPALILLTITICLSPLAAILGLILAIALLYGWLVVGWYLGKRVLQLLNAKQSSPILEMVVGVVTLTLMWRVPAIIPCVGWLFSLLVFVIGGSIGLGAVLLTRFGTRNYNGRTAPVTDYDAIEAESTIAPAQSDALPMPDSGSHNDIQSTDDV